jgi:hypothetical protein
LHKFSGLVVGGVVVGGVVVGGLVAGGLVVRSVGIIRKERLRSLNLLNP